MLKLDTETENLSHSINGRYENTEVDNKNASELEQEVEEGTGNNDNKKETQSKKKKKHYDQKYQVIWEKMPQFRNWITRSPDGIEFFYCNYCKSSYKAGKTEVERHLKSKKHTDNAAGYGQKQIILFDSGFSQKINLEQKCKRNEIKIANFIAEHNLSFNIAAR